MVILMKQNKDLIITQYTKIYQKESLVDKLIFYIPETYDETVDLTTDTVVLFYKNQGNDAGMEILQKKEESEKEGYSTYTMPVTSKFTQFAGKITFRLSIVENHEDTGDKEVLHTSELTINILEFSDYFTFVPDDALSAIDNRIMALDAKADELEATAEQLDLKTPNELLLEQDMLYLAKDEEKLSSGIEILVPGDPDDEDEDHDGVIDIDSLPDNSSVSAFSSGFKFVEL